MTTSASPSSVSASGTAARSAAGTDFTALDCIPPHAIVTVTPNPCLDRTAELAVPLQRGGVNRLLNLSTVAAGKGINVALATLRAKEPTFALAPAKTTDVFCELLEEDGLPFAPTPRPGMVRINLTVLEEDGTTTKLNEPGEPMTDEATAALAAAIDSAACQADWIVLAGSLPPGLDSGWYADTVKRIRTAHPDNSVRIAVDTSDAPLQELGARLSADPDCAPNLVKPNGLEIGQILGLDGAAIEAAADEGDFTPAAQAAAALVERGVESVLLTLGAAGAVLATDQGAWAAEPPPIKPVSTVGAGDSSLAGFLIAAQAGSDPEQRLRVAVAYGTAATSLPGTTIPYPEQTHPEKVKVITLT